MDTAGIEMVIPGLDHYLGRDGKWHETAHHLFTRYDSRDPKRISRRRETQRDAEAVGNQKTLW